MRPSRTRLINAVRRSMIQRAELGRKIGAARSAFTPRALLDRGKYRAGEKIDETAQVVREEFRANRLPIALAAAAGLAWLFREPIKEHAPRLGRRIRDLAQAAADKIRPGDTPDADPDMMEEDDEAVQ